MVDLAKLLKDIDDDIELTEILGESPEFNLRCKVAIRELAAERDALKAELAIANSTGIELLKQKNESAEHISILRKRIDVAEAELEAARNQEPAIYRLRYTEATSGWVDVTKEVYDRHKDSQYHDAKVFYASPVPPSTKQEPCGYMCEDAGITTIYNAAKCTGDFSNYTPVYKNPILPQQETNKKMALIMEIVNQIISDYYRLGSRELWASIQKAEQLLKGGENDK